MVLKYKIGERSKDTLTNKLLPSKKEKESMTKSQFNVQDQFLNQVRREKVRIVVELLSGEKVEGTVTSFDNFSIIIEDKGYRLVYKHGISSIYPANPSPQLKLFEKGS